MSWLGRTTWILALVSLGGSIDAAAGSDRPRLVVLVSVDQLAFDYVRRFRANLADDGFFQRALREGAVFENCHHRHALTITGPGHAVMMTGTFPNRHGIVANSWLDRSSGAVVNCMHDPDAPLIGTVGADQTGSPRNLLVPTLGDVLKLRTAGRAKVFGVGIKDRAAVLTTGHAADGAFWFHSASGKWVTSKYYSDALPGYLRIVNESQYIASFAGRTWDLLLDPSKYHKYRADDCPFETPRYGMTAAFPHTLPAADHKDFYQQLINTPFGNEMTLTAAREIIQYEKLGADDVPDILTVNLSSTDYVGHNFGPYSLEVEDMFYRTDAQLGAFVAFLDRQVGRGRWVLALTSDHGVAPNPQFAKQLGLPARRNPLGELASFRDRLEKLLRQSIDSADTGRALIARVEANQIYLDRDHPQLAGKQFVEAQNILRDWLAAQPFIAAVITREQLTGGHIAHDKMQDMLFRSFHARRSGDVLFVFPPYQYQASDFTASHGSPWQYDTHVPLMFLGAGIRRGVSRRPTSPAAVAPTLARLLEIDPPPACEVRSLDEAIAP